MQDVLVIGAGPAGLSLVAALAETGLAVQGLTLGDPAHPWPNTYGIWVDELEDVGLVPFLEHRWKDCVVHVNSGPVPLHREYGLLSNDRLQAHWLNQAEQHQVTWHRDKAVHIEHRPTHTQVTTASGEMLTARLVVDATGHQAALVQRSPASDLAFQAAYGIVGRFSQPPTDPHQMVLMDFRDDYLTPAQRQEPPTFLYAMDLGDGVHFVEETSLAHHPAISLEVLTKRLHQRLGHRGIEIKETHHVERCLFPMNQPLPDLTQRVVGFGGAASMVHPASGYMVGALLRRGPGLASAIASALGSAQTTPDQAAHQAWQALWPAERVRKHYLYLFGLENLMAFDAPQLHQFFDAFFNLPTDDWSGFLTDNLSLPEVVQAMLGLFGRAPNPVRWGLMRSVFSHGHLLGRTLMS
ncbi:MULTISPECIES: lycopene beta cyclase [Cyanophyceae]|uniref:lycopene beta cyclase n=1 Tax=Cyanophyceae TaxID=3028117 RepID=UPI001688847E|nr:MULTISPECIES: lycopene cyclase family protein [Cyanophyceae]MBD1919197.1 lycopene cyclase family protein [Phormidium sp. FACHB-77]MBD2033427.1 lycopene cyclase family protein [Phormidium sp. FACHB-322]MBD2054149.1 lycopene cyclase family protein [Leptolyngbya sp. FACHB-60]